MDSFKNDPSADVRFQLALILRFNKSEKAQAIIKELLIRNPGNQVMAASQKKYQNSLDAKELLTRNANIFYTIFMGGFYDNLIVKHLPGDATLEGYLKAPENSTAGQALTNAKNLPGPEVLQATLIIPIILILAFSGLVIYMRSQKTKQVINLITT
ncbi:hypothetical protein AAKU52_002570 [Pedobacter sp. CG_S7]|uniref:hypothetical protein n=1 Tax=Pedobacter sp. CG_S7 TaxID=3143930 RepID=UPI003393C872